MRGKKLKLYTHMFYDIKLELQNLFFFQSCCLHVSAFVARSIEMFME